jgi:hypothetical protein
VIRLNKMLALARWEAVECATALEAGEHFDAETKRIIARCDTDEEWMQLDQAVTDRNELAKKTAVLAARTPTCVLWASKLNVADGPGWRSLFMSALAQGQVNRGPQIG